MWIYSKEKSVDLSDHKAGKGNIKMKVDEMRELRGKRAEMVIRTYERRLINGGYDSLFKVYKSCSDLKRRAERYILYEMSDNGGYEYCILGANTCTFSCAYRCGEWLIYHTRDNVRKIKYPA